MGGGGGGGGTIQSWGSLSYTDRVYFGPNACRARFTQGIQGNTNGLVQALNWISRLICAQISIWWMYNLTK